MYTAAAVRTQTAVYLFGTWDIRRRYGYTTHNKSKHHGMHMYNTTMWDAGKGKVHRFCTECQMTHMNSYLPTTILLASKVWLYPVNVWTDIAHKVPTASPSSLLVFHPVYPTEWPPGRKVAPQRRYPRGHPGH